MSYSSTIPTTKQKTQNEDLDQNYSQEQEIKKQTFLFTLSQNHKNLNLGLKRFNYLYVATDLSYNLESFETEVLSPCLDIHIRNKCYQLLTPLYYAYLRANIEKLPLLQQKKIITESDKNTIYNQFQIIHNLAAGFINSDNQFVSGLFTPEAIMENIHYFPILQKSNNKFEPVKYQITKELRPNQ